MAPASRVSPEVAEALSEGRPVVALETTLVAHGLPRPRNLEVGLELEERLRSAGVVPATVAVLDGVPTVGLDRRGLEVMAAGVAVAKASVRDLPALAVRGGDAATTVAATSFIAHRVGIRVFATGGLGGVHRGAATTFDESADLQALARTPVTVVCAGVKSILDVAASLERLETLGVTVLGYRTDRFPGFYLHDSGHDLEWRVDGPEAVAAAMAAADRLGLAGGIVVANPIPVEEQLDPALYQRVLDDALAAAERQGLRGKPVTPFLLDHLQRGTGGASLEANICAVRHNASVAADIARAWAELDPGRAEPPAS
ncbi:MAG: pseudouridine-5'-phosphate glycosidase [Acidimicrobiales bacterium]